MAARPVVATVNGVLDLVVEGVTGHLVPPGRPDLLADRVLQLLARPDRGAAMGGRRRPRGRPVRPRGDAGRPGRGCTGRRPDRPGRAWPARWGGAAVTTPPPLCATVVLLPLLVPRGPGNSAPADLFAAAFIVLALLALLQRAAAWRCQSPGPSACCWPAACSDWPSAAWTLVGALTLAVDVYLVLLLVAVVNHLRGDPATLSGWSWSCGDRGRAGLGGAAAQRPLPAPPRPGWPACSRSTSALAGPRPGWQQRQPGRQLRDGVARPGRLPRGHGGARCGWRALAGGLLLWAPFATGSLGGLFGLAGGVAIALGAYLRSGSHLGQVQALAGAALPRRGAGPGLVLLLAGLPRAGLAEVHSVSERARGSVLQQTVGRAGDSWPAASLWSTAIDKAGGAGPGRDRAPARPRGSWGLPPVAWIRTDAPS